MRGQKEAEQKMFTYKEQKMVMQRKRWGSDGHGGGWEEGKPGRERMDEVIERLFLEKKWCQPGTVERHSSTPAMAPC